MAIEAKLARKLNHVLFFTIIPLMISTLSEHFEVESWLLWNSLFVYEFGHVVFEAKELLHLVRRRRGFKTMSLYPLSQGVTLAMTWFSVMFEFFRHIYKIHIPSTIAKIMTSKAFGKTHVLCIGISTVLLIAEFPLHKDLPLTTLDAREMSSSHRRSNTETSSHHKSPARKSGMSLPVGVALAIAVASCVCISMQESKGAMVVKTNRGNLPTGVMFKNRDRSILDQPDDITKETSNEKPIKSKDVSLSTSSLRWRPRLP